MSQVRVFDGNGNLKRVISAKQVQAISDERFYKYIGITGEKRRIKYKDYSCVECKIVFQSKSTRGAKYCKDCRKKVYQIRKKNARNK